MRRKDQSQRGASAVEFAVMLPLFAVVVFGIIEFGWILYTQGMLTHASREGARFGVVYSTPRHTTGEIQGVVQGYLNTSGLTSPATVAVTGAQGASEAPLRVTVNYTYTFIVLPQNMINNVLGPKMANLNLTAVTQMSME